jgi:hypothetical protein
MGRAVVGEPDAGTAGDDPSAMKTEVAAAEV